MGVGGKACHVEEKNQNLLEEVVREETKACSEGKGEQKACVSQ